MRINVVRVQRPHLSALAFKVVLQLLHQKLMGALIGSG